MYIDGFYVIVVVNFKFHVCWYVGGCDLLNWSGVIGGVKQNSDL